MVSEKLYKEVLEDNNLLNIENKQLKEENADLAKKLEKAERKIKGLEQTIANFKEKEEKHYRNQPW